MSHGRSLYEKRIRSSGLGDTVETYGSFSGNELGTISAKVTSTVSRLSIGLFPGRKRLGRREN